MISNAGMATMNISKVLLLELVVVAVEAESVAVVELAMSDVVSRAKILAKALTCSRSIVQCIDNVRRCVYLPIRLCCESRVPLRVIYA